MQRAKWVEHKGQRIFAMDCTGATLEEMNEVIEECIKQVRSQPEQSTLTMVVAGGTAFSSETISSLKELARGNAPYVKASAIVGITGLYKVVFNAVALFSKRRFDLFDTADEAMDYLAAQVD